MLKVGCGYQADILRVAIRIYERLQCFVKIHVLLLVFLEVEWQSIVYVLS